MSAKINRNGSAMSAYSSASIRLDPNVMISHSELLQSYISSKSIYQLQEKSDLEVQSAKSKVNEILNREKTVIKDSIDPLIINHYINEYRRKEVLNKRWNRAVFEPICDRLSRAVESGSINKLCERKRTLHQNYLDYVNRKKFASLTDYCSDEYYPFALSQPLNNVSTAQSLLYPATKPKIAAPQRSRSANPTAIDEISRIEEDNFQVRCLTGHPLDPSSLLQMRLAQPPLVPISRKGCDCLSWTFMPYGQINSDVRHKCRRRMLGNYNRASTNQCMVNQVN